MAPAPINLFTSWIFYLCKKGECFCDSLKPGLLRSYTYNTGRKAKVGDYSRINKNLVSNGDVKDNKIVKNIRRRGKL